jgi:hypothetical protein
MCVAKLRMAQTPTRSGGTSLTRWEAVEPMVNRSLTGFLIPGGAELRLRRYLRALDTGN